MKKTFTFLVLCMFAIVTFAQVALPENGQEYYIKVGSQHQSQFATNKAYLTITENTFGNATLQHASDTFEERQKFTVTTGTDTNGNTTYKFTATVAGEAIVLTWSADRIKPMTEAAAIEAGAKFEFQIFQGSTDVQGTAIEHLVIQVIDDETVGNRFMAVNGQAIGRPFVHAAIPGWPSMVEFVPTGDVYIPRWDYEGIADYDNTNVYRYFIYFNRTVNGSDVPNLFISTQGIQTPNAVDTLRQAVLPENINDLTAEEANNLKAAIWRISNFNSVNHTITLTNELGQTIFWKQLEEAVGGKNNLFLASTNVPEENSATTTLYIMPNSTAEELYSIGTQESGRHFMNAHGGVSIGGLIAKWDQNDGGSAFSFMSINNVLPTKVIEMIDTTTGITSVNQEATVANNKIYTIDGRFVGTNLNVLPSGIYVVNGKKIVK